MHQPVFSPEDLSAAHFAFLPACYPSIAAPVRL
jgi:hypothetical protein